MPNFLPKNLHLPKLNKQIFLIIIFILLSLFIARGIFLELELSKFSNENKQLSERLLSTQNLLNKVTHEDQYLKNKTLETEIKNIHDKYKAVITTYQNILDLKINIDNTSEIDKEFAQVLNYLADSNYSSASASLTELTSLIETETAATAKTSPAQNTSVNIAASNQAPGSGYNRQAVTTNNGTFTVDIIAADLSSTKVIVDTASDTDCSDNCPVLPLSAYISRNGAYAGINGSFFCPASYPSCAGKTNSFDLLIMNKNKYYFNASNNVYSTNPAVIFLGGGIRFVGQALEWGRDTGVDGVLSNFPLLVSGGNTAYTNGGDAKFVVKGPRDFVGNKGNTVYIGTINNATMGEAAQVLKTLGLDNALNLDEGGSTALWYNGYKQGPGRDIPNAIVFIRK